MTELITNTETADYRIYQALSRVVELTQRSGEYSDFEGSLYAFGLICLKYLHDRAFALSADTRPVILGFTLPPSFDWKYMISVHPTDQIVAEVFSEIAGSAPNQTLADMIQGLKLERLFSTPLLLHKILHILYHEVDFASISQDEINRSINALVESIFQTTGKGYADSYTPHDLSRLLAQLLSPSTDSSILDPTCGTGGLLIAAHQEAVTGLTEEWQARPQLFGLDIRSVMTGFAQANLILHGISPQDIEVGNALSISQFKVKQRIFDYVIAELPVGLQARQLNEATREGMLDSGSYADFAFITEATSALSTNGKAVLLIGGGVLYRSGKEREIRERLVKEDLIEAVISLPSGTLYQTSSAPYILVINKDKPAEQTGRIFFVYADSEYESSRGKNRISASNRERIVNTVLAKECVKRFSTSKLSEDVAANDFVLVPSAYVELVDKTEFLNGDVDWRRLTDLAEILSGMAVSKENRKSGTSPILQGRDISKPNLSVDELETVWTGDEIEKRVFAAPGDILIQRIGMPPASFLVTASFSGILVANTVYVVRLREEFREYSQYIVEFLNSEVGQGILSAQIKGSTVPTLNLGDLRRFEVPLPRNNTVLSALGDLRKFEQDLASKLANTRDLRRKLFSSGNAEEILEQLSQLNTEAQVLNESLQQSDDLDFQIRNFFPYPVAYPYRLPSAIAPFFEKYKEQLRVAENILAFLGSVGLAIAACTRTITIEKNPTVTQDMLKEWWNNGISPGSWRDMGRVSSVLIRREDKLASLNPVSSMWFKGSSERESDFAKRLRDIIELKNAFKHDRGPSSSQEAKDAVENLELLLRECMQSLSVFIQYPLRFVRETRRAWNTSEISIETLLYMGDHPVMKKESIRIPDVLFADVLYLQMEKTFIPLYPLISIHYDPQRKTRETYMIDLWQRSEKRLRLKSFESGNTIESSSDEPKLSNIASKVCEDLDAFLDAYIPHSQAAAPNDD